METVVKLMCLCFSYLFVLTGEKKTIETKR